MHEFAPPSGPDAPLARVICGLLDSPGLWYYNTHVGVTEPPSLPRRTMKIARSVALTALCVCLAGGGSLLQGLDQRLTEELQIRAWLAEDPISCVARGAGVALEEMDKWKDLFVGLERKSAQRD